MNDPADRHSEAAPEPALDPTLDASSQGSSSSSLSSSDQLPFPMWERYKIIAFLGAGGMGSVYKARDPRLHRNIAIKLLRSHPGDSTDGGSARQRKNFEREARAQASIEHPHICKIYEVGEVDGRPYIAMQLIQGSSLAGLQQAMSREEKTRAVQRVAEALDAAHAQNLIHRDIKPGNIMVERRPDGSLWPYLMDFGLAREVDSNSLSITGGMEGTPAFMAPEQARSNARELDRRTDVYGLGATLYSLLAYRPPFVGTSADVLLSILLDEPPALRTFDPGIPPALETIVHKCLEKDPQRRYQTAQALAEDLGRFLDGTRIEARPPGLLRRATRFAQRHKLLVASATTALLAGGILGGVVLRIRRQAAQQERLTQHLGQEVAKMEWLLRSARQLPLHDLEREKTIVRARMERLKVELLSYGERSQGLAHYALGRGHMALHEYPQALTQLRKAASLGTRSAEFDYAFGFVLGKHFEQAMYEARLAGGGDWARRQLAELEPTYLVPALEFLRRSRSAKLDAPEYLEGLIAYYQRDYDTALTKADAALQTAPWLYEAHKLAGDVHHERALIARDTGHDDAATREFAASVRRFRDAIAIGQSDAEVYEALSESWIAQIEMKVQHGEPTNPLYESAIAVSNQLIAADPKGIAGLLKKARASAMKIGVSNVGTVEAEPLKLCLSAGEAVLQQQPDQPYAGDLVANCYGFAGDAASSHGENPLPFLHKAERLLEPILHRFPRFLWGINDLGNIYLSLGEALQNKDRSASIEMLNKALDQFSAAASLDSTYTSAPINALFTLRCLATRTQTEPELQRVLAQSDQWFARCLSVNPSMQQCFNNYFQVFTVAARRALLTGQDLQPRLLRAREKLAKTRLLGESLLDAEEYAALIHWVEATDLVRKQQDPSIPLAELKNDLHRCFALVTDDAMCRTIDAQSEWVSADWEVVQGKSALPHLQSALDKARLATQSPTQYPDAWQTLSESYLKLARLEKRAAARSAMISDGLRSAERALAINPNHALALGTQGALHLLRAQSEPATAKSEAGLAVQRLGKALAQAPYLAHSHQPLLDAARALAAGGATTP